MGFRSLSAVLLGTVVALAPQLSAATEPRTAAAQTVTVNEGTSIAVAASPDGRRLALLLQGAIYVMPAEGGEARRISDPLWKAKSIAWSPDGRWITFISTHDGTYHIHGISPDGGDISTFVGGARQAVDPTWSRDGRKIWYVSDVFNAPTSVAEFDVGSKTTRLVAGTANARFVVTTAKGDLIFVRSGWGQPTELVRLGAAGKETILFRTRGRIGPPALSPDDQHLLYTVVTDEQAQLMLDGKPVTKGEDVFLTRPQWISSRDYLYTADGKIRRRSLAEDGSKDLPFTAKLEVSRPEYTRKKRDFDSTDSRRALGILRPIESPDGAQIAFSALGDLWLMDRGGKPTRMTNDAWEDRQAVWSPDGRQMVYVSDRAGDYDLWLRDTSTRKERRLTALAGAEIRPSWSRDGKSIVFVHTVDNPIFASIRVMDVQTGQSREVAKDLDGPGYPVFSGDGSHILFPKGVSSGDDQGVINQLFSVPVTGGEDKRLDLFANHSISKRTANGPVISPDGQWIAFEMKEPTSADGLSDGPEGIWLQRVAPDGTPQGEARRLAFASPEYLAWSGDGRSLTFLDSDKFRRVEVATGRISEIPIDLNWTPAKPVGRTIVHAGLLVDGVAKAARPNMDVIIEGNRIVAIEPHRTGRKADRFVDASKSALMPGLIEMHDHQMIDQFGTRFERLNLAYGITTARFVGTGPYDVLATRETLASGRRPGPRVFGTGYIFENARMSGHDQTTLVSNADDVKREMSRAVRLQYDWIKTYDRLPAHVEKLVVEAAHAVGLPVTGHELYPAGDMGKDGVEHLNCCTDTKASAMGKVYDDVVQIARLSQIQITPTIGDVYTIVASEPATYEDPRWRQLAKPFWKDVPLTPDLEYFDGGRLGSALADNLAKSVVRLYREGAFVLAGTDSTYVQTPYGISLHGNLERYVRAGMTPYEALRTATVNNAKALNLDAGSIEVGKLADLVIVDGNPLQNIADARRVVSVIVNGQYVTMAEILSGKPN
jgi:Tol biopolymer transport system component/imidazolonepropionase-like amidohydrolase